MMRKRSHQRLYSIIRRQEISPLRQLGYDALGTSRRSVTANGVETVHSSVSLRSEQVLAVNVKASFVENGDTKN